MQITKYLHSCLLVEHEGKVAVLDPGSMSFDVFEFDKLKSLDNILITHIHQDHYHLPFIKKLVEMFPEVHITAPQEVVEDLEKNGIKAISDASEGVELFDAPHENTEPLFPIPQEIGIHYLGLLSDPGDSHSFIETKEILALPITAPWGSTIKAVNLALELKPKYVIPIHDWHWSDTARESMYNNIAMVLEKSDIKMFKPITGEAITIDI
jgi:L-ascorbate metabolism protein UlaG (beta-lactamase superfamily)